jgi:uncharacterized surface protein with fasciclin (FAS1) repeats
MYPSPLAKLAFPKRLFPLALGALLPAAWAQADPTIIGVAAENPDFSTLLSALEVAGLTQELQSEGPFTLFAPTNSAFAALSDDELDTLLADREALRNVLTYHVVPGRYTTADIGPDMRAFDTLQGSELPITQQGVGTATVTAVNLEASNGVVFAIDAVLTPPEGVADEEAPDALYLSTADASTRYPLDDVDGSGVSGSVLVAAYRDEARSVLTVSLTGTAAGATHPARLVLGRCDAPGEDVAELDDVSGSTGFGTTVLDLPFETLTEGERALLIFAAPDDDAVIACGEVGA